MTSLKQYKTEFEACKGNELERVKSFIEHNLDNWSLYEDESLVIDMLDDQNITADDILEALDSMFEYQEENSEFKNAVLAMRLSIEKERLNKRDDDVDDETDSSIDEDAGGFSEDDNVNFYSEDAPEHYRKAS